MEWLYTDKCDKCGEEVELSRAEGHALAFGTCRRCGRELCSHVLLPVDLPDDPEARFDVLLVIDDLNEKHVQTAAILRKFIQLSHSEALNLIHQPQVVVRQDASHYQEQLNFQRALKRIGVRSHIERVKPD